MLIIYTNHDNTHTHLFGLFKVNIHTKHIQQHIKINLWRNTVHQHVSTKQFSPCVQGFLCVKKMVYTYIGQIALGHVLVHNRLQLMYKVYEKFENV